MTLNWNISQSQLISTECLWDVNPGVYSHYAMTFIVTDSKVFEKLNSSDEKCMKWNWFCIFLVIQLPRNTSKENFNSLKTTQKSTKLNSQWQSALNSAVSQVWHFSVLFSAGSQNIKNISAVSELIGPDFLWINGVQSCLGKEWKINKSSCWNVLKDIMITRNTMQLSIPFVKKTLFCQNFVKNSYSETLIFTAPWLKMSWTTKKQEAQSHCAIFRQSGAERIDWAYNNWFWKK